MRDYSELILGLRRHHCDAKEDDTQEVCEECAYDVIVADKSKFNGITDVCTCGLMHRAADAIEELLAELVTIRNQLPQQTVETNIFDIEEIHPNCTVQILKNSITGEVSVGWWENDKNPNEMEESN